MKDDKKKKDMQKEENLYGYDIEDVASASDYTGLIPSAVVDKAEADAYSEMSGVAKQVPAEDLVDVEKKEEK
ncbi:MAG: hypothetical protein ACOX3W_03595 [Christensenellaceae bacterium]|jgi:hypothetical protein